MLWSCLKQRKEICFFIVSPCGVAQGRLCQRENKTICNRLLSVCIVFVVGGAVNENDASGAGDEDVANGELARQ